jgi:RNA polymerase sigma factor (sigma-70 family)
MDFKEIEYLVANAKTHDKSSKEKLAQEFKPFIINLSNKTFINGYDNQDIQNECYRILFKCISLYDLRKHRFVAYATNGIKNSINDLIRKSKNRSSTEGTEALTLSDNLEHTLPSTDSSLEEILCTKTDFELLRQAFDNLDQDEKELITFVYFKNNTLINYAYWKNMCYSTANRKKKMILNKMKRHLDLCDI